MTKRKSVITTICLILVLACVVGGGIVACDNNVADSHSHNWSSWSIAEGDQPTLEHIGKAARTCSGEGSCDAALSDKEHELPALTSDDYSESLDTATCSAEGVIVYSYDHDGVSVSIEVPTSVNGSVHSYGDYVNDDAEGHYKVCSRNSEHKTALEPHDSNGANGACSVCGYVAPAPVHAHVWGNWQVLDGNKPSADSVGKAIRSCSGEGSCDAALSDKEHELPALSSSVYSKSLDTATCSAVGHIDYSYDQGGVKVSFSVATAINPNAHGALIHREGEPASCLEAGKLEHWSCPDCSVLWSDADGEHVISSAVIPASGHGELVHHGLVPAQCLQAGEKEHWTCPNCSLILGDALGESVLESIVIPASGHGELVHREGEPASCLKAGELEHWSCPDCLKLYSDIECQHEISSAVIPANGHGELVHHGLVLAQCLQAGEKEHWTCPNCSLILGDAQGSSVLESIVIPANGHGELVHHQAVAKQCESDGSEEYLSCPDCLKLYSDIECQHEISEPVVIPASHGELVKHSAIAKTCAENGREAYWECSDCHKLYADRLAKNEIDSPVVILAGHELIAHDELINCESDGHEAYWQCLNCGKLYSDESAQNEISAPVSIPAKGHGEKVAVSLSASYSVDFLTGSPAKFSPITNLTTYKGTTVYQCADCGKYFYGDSGQYETAIPYYQNRYGLLLENNSTSTVVSIPQAATQIISFVAPQNGIYKLTLSNGKDANGDSVTPIIYIIQHVAESSNGAVYSGGAFVATSAYCERFLNLPQDVSALSQIEVQMLQGEAIIIQSKVASMNVTVESYDKVLTKSGKQTVSVTKANATSNNSMDVYYYTPVSTGHDSITVPAGLIVALNGDLLIDASGSAESVTQNFATTAGVPIVFTFISATVGDYSVSIGNEILQQIVPGEPVSNLAVPAKGVSVLEVGDVEEGRYRLDITINNGLMRSMVYFGKNINPDFDEIYGPANKYGMGGTSEVLFQNMQVRLQNTDLDYSVSFKNLVISIELDLQQGDKLVFAHSNTVDGQVNVSITKI